MNAIALNISSIPVRQDLDGRFNLNDLHKASGGEQKHQPANWIRLQQTIDLVDFLTSEESITGIPVIFSKQGLGTFAVKELVYAYAMWISAKFHISVIRAYDSLVTTQYGLKQLPEPPTISKAQIGVLYTRVNSIAGPDNKMRASIWSRFQNHFKINSYKELPAINYDDACIYLDNKSEEYRQGVDMMYISSKELEDRIDQRIKSLEPVKPLPDFRTKILLCIENDVVSQSIVPYGSCIIDPSSELSIKTVINEYVPAELLNHVIMTASQKMHLINNRLLA